jgi:phosphatidate cytidylyltransferase
MGAVMVLLACGLLIGDEWWAPWYPGLLLCLLGLGTLAVLELHALLADLPQPPRWLLTPGVLAVLLSNWLAHLPPLYQPASQPWSSVLGVFTGVVLLVFVHEMAIYRKREASKSDESSPLASGSAVVRLALAVWCLVYLGLLPSFLAQLRWWPPTDPPVSADRRGLLAVLLVIFIPKFCDIGAYFTGRLLGRHPMSPELSPRKTWEGLAGGLLTAAVLALLLNRLIDPGTGSPLLGADSRAAAFGLTVGGAAVLGDLAESLIKRDRGHKDASRLVPGFGGILDVIDSVLFAAPVAYWWLRG